MDSGWPNSPGALIPVGESVEVLKSALGRALFMVFRKRQSEALPETHQGLLLYSNPASYWEDWSGGLSPSEKSPRDWLLMLPLWTGSRDF